MDLEKLEAQLDAANAESGPWAIEPDVADNVGLWIEALGDGGEPGEAAALFLRDIRETVLQLVIEARAGREAHDKLVEMHDDYDADRDRFKVRGKLFAILHNWSLKSSFQPADIPGVVPQPDI